MKDTDEFDYFPLRNGTIPVSSLKTEPLSLLPQRHQTVFQIDRWTPWFLENKEKCRSEDLSKYYRTKSTFNRTPIIKFLIERLSSEYPNSFKWDESGRRLFCSQSSEQLTFDADLNLTKETRGRYVDSLDALMMQVPEDAVVCSLDENENDFISCAHLMAPAEQSAGWVIGKSFAEIHDRIKRADGTHVIKNPTGLVRGLLRMPHAVQRVGAVSFRSDIILNLHPENYTHSVWTWDDSQNVYLRFERQTLTPFPEANSFLFTVKPYWANLLRPDRLEKAIEALQQVNPNVHSRGFLHDERNNLLKFLLERRNK